MARQLEVDEGARYWDDCRPWTACNEAHGDWKSSLVTLTLFCFVLEAQSWFDTSDNENLEEYKVLEHLHPLKVLEHSDAVVLPAFHQLGTRHDGIEQRCKYVSRFQVVPGSRFQVPGLTNVTFGRELSLDGVGLKYGGNILLVPGRGKGVRGVMVSHDYSRFSLSDMSKTA